MNHLDAQKWNKRFREEGQTWLKNKPSQLLVDNGHQLPTIGLALDVAAGVGTNGLFLAKRGLHVVALDISEVGLRLGRTQALAGGLNLETAVIDLSTLWLPTNCFDVIVNFRFLERATFPVFQRALKPGGWLIFETFLRRETAVVHPHYYLQPDELCHAFPDFEIMHYEETNGRRKNVAQLIARKPSR